ncbi:MAG: type II toxin-antitoxin system death-on-curing family toxin [Thermoplasmata archaeon]|nr:type II toxin-antitoxin system death-on-curing family toxin [Thermoplasmata archaeon]
MEDIIRIHDIRVTKANQKKPESTQTGTPPSGYGQIENLLDRVQTYDIPATYRNIVKTAARLYEGISRRHPFVDCNKRTAIVTVFETCLMNRYYLRKLDKKEEVDFALKVASTDLDEFGFEEICKHFDERIIPYKTFAAKRFANNNLRCPYCGSEHKLIPGICQCGKQLMKIRITHQSIINKYTFIFTIKELSRLRKIK